MKSNGEGTERDRSIGRPDIRLQDLAQTLVDVLDHATSEIAIGIKFGIDATKKLPGEGFKHPWQALIKMDLEVKAKVEKLFKP